MIFERQADLGAIGCRAQTSFHDLLGVVGQIGACLKLGTSAGADTVDKVLSSSLFVCGQGIEVNSLSVFGIRSE